MCCTACRTISNFDYPKGTVLLSSHRRVRNAPLLAAMVLRNGESFVSMHACKKERLLHVSAGWSQQTYAELYTSTESMCFDGRYQAAHIGAGHSRARESHLLRQGVFDNVHSLESLALKAAAVRGYDDGAGAADQHGELRLVRSQYLSMQGSQTVKESDIVNSWRPS